MNNFDRREFLFLSGLAAAGTFAPGTSAAQKLDLSEKTVAELSAAMAKGQLTSEAITNWYLARIRSVDPKINSIIELIPTRSRSPVSVTASGCRGTLKGHCMVSPF